MSCGRAVKLLFWVRAMQPPRSVAACHRISIDGRGKARTNTIAQIILLDQKSLSAESLKQSRRRLPQIPTKPYRAVSSQRRDEVNDSAQTSLLATTSSKHTNRCRRQFVQLARKL